MSSNINVAQKPWSMVTTPFNLDNSPALANRPLCFFQTSKNLEHLAETTKEGGLTMEKEILSKADHFCATGGNLGHLDFVCSEGLLNCAESTPP